MTIRSTSSVRFAIATLTTVMSVNPAFLILFRSTEAPIALEPIPASQAKTILWIGLVRVGRLAGLVGLLLRGLDVGQHAGHRALLALHRLHLRGRRGQVAALARTSCWPAG